MRYRHIEVFNAVYAVGSVSGAARFLNITQPTASKILKHAEDQIGFPLFHRVRGRLIPTDEAKVLYRETRGIADRLTDLQMLSQNIARGTSGRIGLASIAALGLELVPKAIMEFRQTYPDVQLEFQTLHYDNLIHSLQQREKDLGFAFNGQSASGINFIELGTAEFVCIYSKGEFDVPSERIKLSDVSGHSLIGIDNSGPLGDLLNAVLLENTLTSASGLTVQTYFAARNLVAMGAGIAIVDEFTATSHGVGTVEFKGFDPPISISVQALHRASDPLPKIHRNFLAVLRQKIASHPNPCS